jgi:hypothetical protein
MHEFGQELPRHVGLKQSIAVLREDRRHPYRIVNAEPHEPAIEQVVVELLHQLSLRPDRIERLQQQRPQQPLRRYRRSTTLRVGLRKVATKRCQNLVHHAADQPQRALRRNPLLQVHIREQLTCPLIPATHPRLPNCPRHESYSQRLVRRLFQQPASLSASEAGQAGAEKDFEVRPTVHYARSPRCDVVHNSILDAGRG